MNLDSGLNAAEITEIVALSDEATISLYKSILSSVNNKRPDFYVGLLCGMYRYMQIDDAGEHYPREVLGTLAQVLIDVGILDPNGMEFEEVNDESEDDESEDDESEDDESEDDESEDDESEDDESDKRLEPVVRNMVADMLRELGHPESEIPAEMRMSYLEEITAKYPAPLNEKTKGILTRYIDEMLKTIGLY